MDQQHGGDQPPDQPTHHPDNPDEGLYPEVQPPTPAIAKRAAAPPPVEEDDDEDEGMLRMSFMDHLEELRSRIINTLWGVGAAFAISMALALPLWNVIQQPLRVAVDGLHGDIVALTPM